MQAHGYTSTFLTRNQKITKGKGNNGIVFQTILRSNIICRLRGTLKQTSAIRMIQNGKQDVVGYVNATAL